MVKFDLSDDWPGLPETKPVPTPHQERDFDAPGKAVPDGDGHAASGPSIAGLTKPETAGSPAAGDPEAEE